MAINDADQSFLMSKTNIDTNYTTCVTYSSAIKISKGIHIGEEDRFPDYHVFPYFMLQLILSSLMSRLIYFLLKPLKQPKMVCNILSGIVLGPSVLCRNKLIMDTLFPRREMVVINTLCTLGGVYYVFILSVKTDTGRVFRAAKNAWFITVACMVIPFMITIFLSRMLSDRTPGVERGVFRLHFSSVLSLTFFSSVADAVSELKLLASELGELTTSSAFLNEIMGWSALITEAVIHKSLGHRFESFLYLCGLLIFAFLFIRPVIFTIVKRTPEGKPVKESYLIGLMILPLVMGALTDMLGVSFALGALVVGLMIPAGPPLGSLLAERCDYVITDILLPFFYLRVGLLTNVHSIKNWKSFAALELILIGAYVGKLVGSLLVLLFFRTSFRFAILFGFVMNFKGINEYMLLNRWRVNFKTVDEASYATLVLSNLAVTAIVTPLVSIYYKPRRRPEGIDDPRMRTLQTTPINSELRIFCGVHYEENVRSIITLLKACNPRKESPICAYLVHLIELAGRAAPVIAPYNAKNRRLIRENYTYRITCAAEKFLKNSDFPVTILPFKMMAPHCTMHESINKLVNEKFIPLILLPFHRRGLGGTASMHNFNMNIEAYAPCTVGFLVDKGSSTASHLMSTGPFTYKVAVFFLGGPDDREAIALVSRMSGHPDVSITVFRISVTHGEPDEYDCEKHLDEIAINEFIAKNIKNSRVRCREVVAKNTMELMDAFRSMNINYNLLIVGKRRAAGSQLEKEMSLWVEYEELGVIGDMLASADFCKGMMMSVLVIQCGLGSEIIEEERSEEFTFASSKRKIFTSSNCDRKSNGDEKICTKV